MQAHPGEFATGRLQLVKNPFPNWASGWEISLPTPLSNIVASFPIATFLETSGLALARVKVDVPATCCRKRGFIQSRYSY